jgi:tRNA G37 N-methylase Trm5
MRTLDAVTSVSQSKGRPLVVADPYAGVGPSMALLYTDANLVSKAYVNDMNPDATPLLKQNMEYFHSKRKQDGTYVVDCMDARKLVKSRPEMIGTVDVLLVNLPHESVDHLPDLLPLLLNDESLVCGWSIQEKQAEIEHQLLAIIEASDWTITKIHVEEIKGFSTAKAMFRYELVLSNKNKR